MASVGCGRLDYDLHPSGSDAGPQDAGPQDAGPQDAGPQDAQVDGARNDAGSPPDYCVEIPALPDPPAIDGRLDGALALRAIVPVGWSGPGAGPTDPIESSYAVGWRPDGLYFFVHVRDPSVFAAPPGARGYWCGDAPELYVDADGILAEDYDLPGTAQMIAAAPEGEAAVAKGDRYANTGRLGRWDGAFSTFRASDGYVLEAFVQAGELDLPSWSLSAGSSVGIDVSINVSTPDGSAPPGGCGVREGQFFLRIGSEPVGLPFEDARGFCNATLR